MTDEQLIRQIRKGNIKAIDELYARYAQKLYIFFRATMKTKHPKDLVHDTFLRVIDNANRFNPKKAALKTWLFRIARNLCIDHIRREQKMRLLQLEKAGSEDGVSSLIDETDTEESLIRASVFQAVRDCIGELKKFEHRQAIVLYYMLGKVYREISIISGKSISMVKKRIETAKKKVKECLERKGYGVEY